MNIRIYEESKLGCLHTFDSYMYWLNGNEDNFINDLMRMNTDSIKLYLAPLFHYGLIDILLPLNEYIPFILENETQKKWWRDTVSGMENNKIVLENEDAFHDEIEKKSPFYSTGGSYKESLKTILHGLSRKLTWACVGSKVTDYLKQNNNNIGIIVSGLFDLHLKTDFLQLLDTYILPHLFSELDAVSQNLDVSGSYKKAALTYITNCISQGLGDRYYNQFLIQSGSIVNNDNNRTEIGFYQIKDYELKTRLFDKANIDDYLSPSYLESIDKLNSYAANLKLDGYTNRALKLVAPLLHQCIGENEKANNILLEIQNSFPLDMKYSSIALLALYRAAIKNRYNERDQFIGQMRILWASNNIPDTLIITIDSIINFYRNLSKEIPQRYSV